MTKPLILLLHYAAPPTIGGVESTIARHATLLAEHGYSVETVVGAGQAFDARVPVHVIPDAGSRSPRVSAVNAQLERGETGTEFRTLVADLTQELGLLCDRVATPV